MDFGDLDRRTRMVVRHHLGGEAESPEAAADGVAVLHATDPATVYLSVLARSAVTTVSDVAAALYDRRTLVRLMAMRRTLFVVPQALVPIVHHGAALEIAAMVRKRLLSQLQKLPTEPRVPSDPSALAAWLDDVAAGVEAVLQNLGTATGAQLSTAEPRLRTALLPTTDKAYDVRRNITTQVLTMVAAQGRMVRSQPRGEWTSRHHTWQPITAWWPGGIPELDPTLARRDLVRAYLRTFGPATDTDLAWWTGWSARQARAALAGLDVVEVGVSSGAAWVLADDADVTVTPPATACLLPALDPTPMGWKERDWFLPTDSKPLYDPYGNVGPTIWWDGEVVGGWAVTGQGRIAPGCFSIGAQRPRRPSPRRRLDWRPGWTGRGSSRPSRRHWSGSCDRAEIS